MTEVEKGWVSPSGQVLGPQDARKVGQGGREDVCQGCSNLRQTEKRVYTHVNASAHLSDVMTSRDKTRALEKE